MLDCRIVSQGALDGEAAQVDDPVDAVDDLLDLVDAGEVGGDERLVGAQIGRAS